ASPAFSVVARYSRIIIDEKMPASALARTDGVTIALSPAVERLSATEQVFVIAHELLHNFLMHVQRARVVLARHGALNEQSWLVANIVADFIVNNMLKSVPLFSGVDVGGVQDVENKCFDVESTFEEIIECLIKSGNVQYVRGGGGISARLRGDMEESEGGSDGGSSSSDDGGKSQKVLYEGDKAAAAGQQGGKELNPEAIRSELERRSALIAGLGAGNTAFEIDVLKASRRWQVVLRRRLSDGYMKSKRSYNVLNRKRLEDDSVIVPGRRYIGAGRLVACIDVSGSVDEDQIAEFLGIAQSFSGRFSKSIVVFWDDGVRSVEDLRRLRSRVKLAGRGGTEFTPVRDFLVQKLKLRPSDVVVIMSDFYWSESTDEMNRILDELRRKCELILLTSGREVKGAIKVKSR
ncbi:MAG: VWA-like domain-containing protein, partial [Nanopusillaceae archaeon]